MISTTNLHMLTMLADVLHGRQPAPVAEDEWPALFRELSAQTVFALPAEYLNTLGLSAENEIRYLKAVVKNRQTFYSLLKEQERTLSILDEAEISAVVIKGAAAAASYPHPENRCMGDIDLLVLPQDFERAYAVLVSAGYKTEQTLDDYIRHIELTGEDNIEIELHNNFSSGENQEQNTILDEALFRAIPSRQAVTLCGSSVPVLPPLENGLVLLAHINQHLRRGLGLRQIIDWMLFAEKYVDDDFWGNTFAEKAEKIGMKRLAIIVTAMCQKYLGMQGNIHWCKYEPVCDKLMEYIFTYGNFGYKLDRAQFKTVFVLRMMRNPIRGFSEMQSSGLLTWKAAQKHRWLRPFAWCYQLVRWTKLGIKNGVSAEMLDQATSSAKEEYDLLKNLGITRI